MQQTLARGRTAALLMAALTPAVAHAHGTAEINKSSTKCLATVSKAVAKSVSSKHKLLAKCMDKVQAWQAKAALLTPPGNLASAAGPPSVDSPTRSE